MTARSVALGALRRIEDQGAYANLVLNGELERSDLSDADRRFATDLVYGTTRMRRACDALVDRFVTAPPDAATRTVLRLGAYQLAFGGVAAHAAVGETVSVAPKRTRGFVNAVLRNVSRTPMVWPSEWTRLSYPDWIGELLAAELGADDALAAAERMNEPPPVSVRDDGYVQDASSQWVAAAVGAVDGERVLDVCAAPGGKATAIAAGAECVVVVAADMRAEPGRPDRPERGAAGADRSTARASRWSLPMRRHRRSVPKLVRRGARRCPVQRAGRAAPATRCALEGRTPSDVVGAGCTAALASSPRVAPLVRSPAAGSCTACARSPPPSRSTIRSPMGFVDRRRDRRRWARWRPFGHGWGVLPQDADTDGMVIIRYRRPA